LLLLERVLNQMPRGIGQLREQTLRNANHIGDDKAQTVSARTAPRKAMAVGPQPNHRAIRVNQRNLGNDTTCPSVNSSTSSGLRTRTGISKKVADPAVRRRRPRAAFVEISVILLIHYPASSVEWSAPVLDFEELRELAADVRVFIDLAEDKAATLRGVIAAYDVVVAIFPSGDEMGLYVVRGRHILESIAKSATHANHAYTAIAVPDFEHAEALRHLTEPMPVKLAA
jgi:hypothetical protein